MIRDIFLVDPLASPAVLLPVLGVLFLFFFGLEWRAKPRFLYGRCVALLVLFGSVTALLLRPYYFSLENEQPALLLTPGFNTRTLDSLRTQHELEILQLSPSLDANARLISPHELGNIQSRLVAVLGEGIPAGGLHQRELAYFYEPANAPTGFSDLRIPVFQVGMPGLISGSYTGPSDSTQLYLIGPGGVEDSTRLAPDSTAFNLQVNPKQSGHYTYELEARQANSLVRERVPIQVLPERKLNILFLQTHPTFETRYLKNYLADKGHSLLVRYLVSQNTYRFEFANRSPEPLDRLSPSLLRGLDLVITSDNQLKGLSAGEHSMLQQAIKNGLGLLVVFTDAKSEMEKAVFPIALNKVTGDTLTLEHFSWPTQLPATALPLRVEQTPDITPVWKDENGAVVSGYLLSGLGKVGFQLLTHTHLLSLEGKTDEFALLWSPLLEGIARKLPSPCAIRIITPPPYFTNRPLQVDVVAAGEKPELYFDTEFIPLRENSRIGDIWTTTIWANTSGWHSVATQDSTQRSFFVHEVGEWQTLDKVNQQRENQAHHTSNLSTRGKSTDKRKNISPLLFLIPFLLASGFLWISPKL